MGVRPFISKAAAEVHQGTAARLTLPLLVSGLASARRREGTRIGDGRTSCARARPEGMCRGWCDGEPSCGTQALQRWHACRSHGDPPHAWGALLLRTQCENVRPSSLGVPADSLSSVVWSWPHFLSPAADASKEHNAQRGLIIAAHHNTAAGRNQHRAISA